MCIANPSLAADKHALLIAIEDYRKTSFNSLKGAANDVKLTENMLRERFGYQNVSKRDGLCAAI